MPPHKISLVQEDGKTFADLNTLFPWPHHPRGIANKDFIRLKAQILQLGEYKPLLIEDNGTILGGRTRYLAYQEIGMKRAWVSIVFPKTDEDRIRYLLSDNDSFAYWEEQDLADLLSKYQKIELKDYKVNVSPSISIEQLLAKFGPGEEPPQGEKKKKVLVCPKCGYKIGSEDE